MSEEKKGSSYTPSPQHIILRKMHYQKLDWQDHLCMDEEFTNVTYEMIDIALLASDGIDHPER